MIQTAIDNQAPHTNPEGFWKQVWHGFSRPSLSGLIATGLVVVVLFILSLVCVTPDHLAELDHRYFMTVHIDDYTEISFEAMRATKAGPKPFAVAIFGDSAIRSAMTDTHVIEDRLADELGRQIPVHYLAAKGMNLIEIAGVMDYIDKDFHGIVVIQMGLYQLAQTAKELAIPADLPRLAIHSDVYDEELARVTGQPPRRTGVYLLDHWGFYAYRLNHHALYNLLFGPTPPPLAPRVPMSDQKWQIADQNVRANLNEYLNHRDRNVAVINRMVQRLRQSGRVEVVLVETPKNPRWHRLVNPKLAVDHQQYWTQWTQDQKLHYWDLNDEAQVTVDDFYDYVHFATDEARQQFISLLSEHITDLAVQWHTDGGL